MVLYSIPGKVITILLEGKNGFVSFYCLKFNLAPANKEYKVCVVCERET